VGSVKNMCAFELPVSILDFVFGVFILGPKRCWCVFNVSFIEYLQITHTLFISRVEAFRDMTPCRYVFFYLALWVWVLKRIFGPKRDEVTRQWRKLHNEELNDVYCSTSIFRVIK